MSIGLEIHSLLCTSIAQPEDELQQQFRKFVNKPPCPEEAFCLQISYKQLKLRALPYAVSSKVLNQIFELCKYASYFNRLAYLAGG